MTRKLYFLIPCLIMTMITFTGCGDDNNDGSTGDVLSVEQSKEKLSEIGRNFINLINADDQKKLGQVADYFSGIVGSLEIRERANILQMVQSVVAASKGDMTRVYGLAAVNNEMYQASDYYGVYTYNKDRRNWSYTDSSSELALRFDYEGQAAEIRVAATGNTTDFTYDGVTVKIPAKLTATVKLGSITLTTFEITTANVNSSPRKADIAVNIDASGYKISTSISATPQVVKANYSVSIKGTEAVKGEAYLNGNNMTADEGANENVGDRFKDAQVMVNIMNEATIAVKCSSYKDLAREMEQVENQYDNAENMWGQSHQAMQATVNVYKKYLYGDLTFGRSDTPSAILAFQPYLEYSYTNNQGVKYEYWYTEPLLQFEDDSLISFDNYFDAASGPFKSLADSFEGLIRSFDGFLD